MRKAAFNAIINVYIKGHKVKGVEWFGVLKWLLDALATERSPSLKYHILKELLDMHADTINDKWKELQNHSSPSGALYPLAHTYDDLMRSNQGSIARDVTSKLWLLMNEAFAFDGRLRMTTHQLWRAIWGLETPPIYYDIEDPVNDGPYRKWDAAWQAGTNDSAEATFETPAVEDLATSGFHVDVEGNKDYVPPPEKSSKRKSWSNNGRTGEKVKKIKLVLKRK